jgi:formate C-acetyltransferase
MIKPYYAWNMNTIKQPVETTAGNFLALDEPYGYGFFEEEGRSRFFRFARAQRRFWELSPMPGYAGSGLYPSGKKYVKPCALTPDYSFTFSVNYGLLKEKWEEGVALMQEETALLSCAVGLPHNVGGDGYTHSIPRYERILREGLDSYERRVLALEAGDFRDGLLEILEGIKIYHRRSVEYLELVNTDASKKLIAALGRVPFKPARDLYEALVCWNFIYYIDGCDNPGRLDADLIEYYRGGDYTALLREFFRNVDENSGWSSALGPECNELTLQCLIAIKGMRRPSLELRVSDAVPDKIWQAAAEALSSGCGQPALYNEELYQKTLSEYFPEIPREDLKRFNGGGCTETMLAGISNAGSLDAGINLPFIFEAHIKSAFGEAAGQDAVSGFAGFYGGLIAQTRREILDVLEKVSSYQERRARYRPQPVRTFLIDDCIDKAKDFNAGGARHYWSVINLAGLVNVIDSLLAVRELVYDKKEFTPQAFLSALGEGSPAFRAKLRGCPCFGVDNPKADELASGFAGEIFDMFSERTPYLGGRFLPSSIQFATYADAGRKIGATPDGREAFSPLADSLGAIHGKDTAGPTALLNSVTKMPLYKAAGTPILNLRLKKEFIAAALKPLVTGYFAQGGMQIQISCLSREDMLDAVKHPEKHENLIVRIGGYSEYFNNLSPELKETVIKRTEFEYGGNYG